MFRDAGLTSVEVQPVGFGAATIYSGIKTNADHAFDAVPKHHPIYNAALKGRSVLSKLTDKKR